MTLCYTGTEDQIIIAINQINTNCGLPFRGTQTWDIPKKAYSYDFWFIYMPPTGGWIREDGTYFTQQQMIDGVVNVSIQESQPDWWPPPPSHSGGN